MAVIQDMPAEIFRRILKLGAADSKCFKELLDYEWWSPHLQRASKYTTCLPARLARLILLNSSDTVAMARRLVEHNVTRLDEVNTGSEISSADVDFFLEQGSRAPGNLGEVRNDTRLPDGIQLALESLWLGSSFNSPPEFLLNVFDKAPRLSRLVLVDHFMNQTLTVDIQLPLINLAPQLRHLVLVTALSTVGGLDYVALLRACTSLRTLCRADIPPQQLCEMLSSVPSPLVLLHTDFDVKNPKADEEVSKALLGAFSQPALTGLKRWRWGRRTIWNGPERIPHSEEIVESWEVACRARGIEPRGEELYYTD